MDASDIAAILSIVIANCERATCEHCRRIEREIRSRFALSDNRDRSDSAEARTCACGGKIPDDKFSTHTHQKCRREYTEVEWEKSDLMDSSGQSSGSMRERRLDPPTKRTQVLRKLRDFKNKLAEFDRATTDLILALTDNLDSQGDSTDSPTGRHAESQSTLPGVVER